MLLSSSGVRLRSGREREEGRGWMRKLQTEKKWTGGDEERGGRSVKGRMGMELFSITVPHTKVIEVVMR